MLSLRSFISSYSTLNTLLIYASIKITQLVESSSLTVGISELRTPNMDVSEPALVSYRPTSWSWFSSSAAKPESKGLPSLYILDGWVALTAKLTPDSEPRNDSGHAAGGGAACVL